MSKLLFMCPNKRNVEKSLFISSKVWGKYSGISGKNETYTQFFPKLHSACGERVWQKFPRNFFQFSAGCPNWTLAPRRKFSSKKIFHEKNIYFYRFRTLTELHLRVQRKVLFRNAVLDFFHQGMNLSRNFVNLVEFLWIFQSKPPSTSPPELL